MGYCDGNNLPNNYNENKHQYQLDHHRSAEKVKNRKKSKNFDANVLQAQAQDRHADPWIATLVMPWMSGS